MWFEKLTSHINRATFADESFKIADDYEPVVNAQLPDWIDLRWYWDLTRKFGGRELKWQVVRRRWPDLGVELRRATLWALREALIIIIDPRLYRFSIEQTVTATIRQPRTRWPAAFRSWVETHLLPTYISRGILLDSPASRIQDFLEDHGVMLGGVGGIDGNADEDRTILTDLEGTLGNPHNIRLFGARSAAAFAHLLDPDGRARAIELLLDMRYVNRRLVDGLLLAAGEHIQRVFDEGNRKTVAAIVELQQAVRARLAAQSRLLVPEGTSHRAVELSSRDTPLLQAADITAGYAKTLYAQSDGLKAVCEEFRAVILNGSMVRDWTRVERPNAVDLRVRT